MPWIAPNLLDVPGNASWPRFMSRPHPSAVGSYGEEFAAWSRARSGRPLRWWQRLAAARLLEHDAVGHLVWLWAVLSTSRQVGKSVLLGELALWRLAQAARWGEPQLALLVSKDVAAVQEVHRPALAWAEAQGWTVRRANGQQQIEDPATGSRWAIRGSGSTYSYAVSLGLLDEAWSLPESVARLPQFVGGRMRRIVRQRLRFSVIRAGVAVCPRASGARGGFVAGVGVLRRV